MTGGLSSENLFGVSSALVVLPLDFFCWLLLESASPVRLPCNCEKESTLPLPEREIGWPEGHYYGKPAGHNGNVCSKEPAEWFLYSFLISRRHFGGRLHHIPVGHRYIKSIVVGISYIVHHHSNVDILQAERTIIRDYKRCTQDIVGIKRGFN